MSFDLAALTERLKRAATAADAVSDGASAQVTAPAEVERPWLTAEAFMPPVTGQGGEVYSNSAPTPAPAQDLPPRRVSGRGPKRRRWQMPGNPAERNAEPVDPPAPQLHMCPHCRTRHQPIPMGGGGMADAYSRSVLPDPTRPEPLGRGPADTSSLVRDAFNPWRGRLIEEPPAPPMTMRERLAHLWQGDQ